jgi:hypothetical protein
MDVGGAIAADCFTVFWSTATTDGGVASLGALEGLGSELIFPEVQTPVAGFTLRVLAIGICFSPVNFFAPGGSTRVLQKGVVVPPFGITIEHGLDFAVP